MGEERLQRRLAAILSADVVGYSRLMGLDEAGTLSRLNALRRELIDPTIAAHAGKKSAKVVLVCVPAALKALSYLPLIYIRRITAIDSK